MLLASLHLEDGIGRDQLVEVDKAVDYLELHLGRPIIGVQLQRTLELVLR